VVSVDFEAEGLLEGVQEGRAREARLELLRTLSAEGFSLDDLRAAAAENRLALLPVERVLAAEEPRYTVEDLANETGLDVPFLLETRRALGAPRTVPGDRTLTEGDLELARNAAVLLASGIDRSEFLSLTRVMSRAMATVAAAFTTLWGEALLRPGDTERDLGLRYAESLRELGPLAGPTLEHMLNLRLAEQVRQAVVGQAELESGRLPGAQPITAGFVDIVGFTSLGEQVPPDRLGAVIGGFESSLEDAVEPPVRLVKTIGDGALLVAPEAGPVVTTVVGLVERSRDDDGTALLRGGIASGEALPRAGDWYGRPVNLAARLTAFARRGSVVASREVRDAAVDGYSWSPIGRRRFKGVSGDVEVFRVRPGSEPGS
jgi:adenylate cyclase